MKKWFDEDVWDKLDFDLLSDEDEKEIQKAFELKEDVKDSVERVKTLRDYSHFVYVHFNDIKKNIEIINDVIMDLYEIRSLSLGEKVMKSVGVDCKEAIFKYNTFWEQTYLLKRMDLRLYDSTLPENPFNSIIEILKKNTARAFDRDKRDRIKDIINDMQRCKEYAEHIEKLCNGLIKYDVSDDYEGFNESLLGAFEQLMGSSEDFIELTIDELEKREELLVEWLDQYEFICRITDEAVGKR